MSEIIFVIEEAPEGGFTARALEHSVFTEADDMAGIHEKVKEAVHCHFEEHEKPKVIRLHFSKQEIIAA